MKSSIACQPGLIDLANGCSSDYDAREPTDDPFIDYGKWHRKTKTNWWRGLLEKPHNPALFGVLDSLLQTAESDTLDATSYIKQRCVLGWHVSLRETN